MSINGIGAANSSIMYAYSSQLRQNNSAETASGIDISTQQKPRHSLLSPSANDDDSLMAEELGVRMRIQGQESGNDQGFTVEQLKEMAEEDSPMSELFSVLAENFEAADTDGDGGIKREEAMAYTDEMGISMPPPPGDKAQMMAMTDNGFTAEQLSDMAAEDSPMSELFSVLAENFDAADTDGDGVIKREEAMAYAQNMGLEFPEPGQRISTTA